MVYCVWCKSPWVDCCETHQKLEMLGNVFFWSSCLYRASVTIKTLYYPTDEQICCHNTDYVHVNGHDRTITVILAENCIQSSLMMDPLWSETCWSNFKYFIIILIVSTNVCICWIIKCFNPLNAELNSICHLLVLLGARHILHISRIRVNSVLLIFHKFLWYFHLSQFTRVLIQDELFQHYYTDPWGK